MKVEFLYFSSCPAWEQALSILQSVINEIGVSAELELREITRDTLSAEPQFHGSPTILVDGCDIDPVYGGVKPGGMTCRMYAQENGGLSSLPDRNKLREALSGTR